MFRVISKPHGLIWTDSDFDYAERIAIIAAAITKDIVYLQDGTDKDVV